MDDASYDAAKLAEMRERQRQFQEERRRQYAATKSGRNAEARRALKAKAEQFVRTLDDERLDFEHKLISTQSEQLDRVIESYKRQVS